MTERTRILIEAVAFEILGVLNYVLHTALYLPLLLIWASLTPHFAATFVMFRIILRPEFRQQIFRDTWVRQRSPVCWVLLVRVAPNS